MSYGFRSLLKGLAVVGFFTSAVVAQAAEPSPYAGQEQRAIKSLSAEDLETLRKGGGWGLAKPAELNGMPGPTHLLELKAEIPLSADQVAAVEKLYRVMKDQAIEAGEHYIHQESLLEQQFRDGSITEASLKKLLAQIAESRAALRYIHLQAHLETPKLLSPEQIAKYNTLRGYDLLPDSGGTGAVNHGTLHGQHHHQ